MEIWLDDGEVCACTGSTVWVAGAQERRRICSAAEDLDRQARGGPRSGSLRKRGCATAGSLGRSHEVGEPNSGNDSNAAESSAIARPPAK